MARIAPFGRYRAFDANGAPLNGGKLFTYEAGTSTPKTTYTTKAAGAANPNPVVLDANGYADVWLDTGGYKFVLQDAAGNLLWTVDNIDGGGSTGYASTVISKAVGFTLSTNEQNNVVVCTAPITIGLLPAATAGDGFAAVIVNRSTGNVTIDPDGSELIDGAATLVIPAGNSVTIVSNGTAWVSFGYTRRVLSSVFEILDGTDVTKKLGFNLSAIVTATKRILGIQDVDGTIYVTGGVDVGIADGGTGQSTALAAFNALKQAATTAYQGVVQLATSVEALAGSDALKALTPATLFAALNVTAGGPPLYPVRAWVRWTGGATPVISAGGNVASVVRNGLGDFTVNFTTAMPDVNFSWSAGCTQYVIAGETGRTTSSLRVTINQANSLAFIDPTSQTIMITR